MGKKLTTKERLSFIGTRAAIGVGSLLTAAFAASNVAYSITYDDAKTPLEFAEANGMIYSQHTRDTLAKFDDVRIFALGSPELEKFCSLNIWTCETATASDHGNIAILPKWLGIIRGMKPTVILHPYNDNLAGDVLKFATGKESEQSAERSKMEFNSALFHEVIGHVGSYHVKGTFDYHATPQPMKEYEADVAALPHIGAEHGPRGQVYLLRLRALGQRDHEHDTLFPLMGYLHIGRTGDGRLTDADRASGELFRIDLASCMTERPEEKDTYKAHYDCIKAADHGDYQGLPASVGNSFVQRKAHYVSSYEYFFKNSPSTP